MKKVFLWVLSAIFLLLILLGTYVYFNAQNIANDILRNEIIKKYNEDEDSKYVISLEKVHLNLITGSIKILNIDVVPKDSIVSLQSSLSEKVFQSTSLKVYINEISLQGFNYIQAFKNRVITIDKFTIHSPEIFVYRHDGIPVEETEGQDTIDLRSIFLTHYDTFRISEVVIQDAFTSVNKVSLKNDTLNQFAINHLSYHVNGVEANSQTLYSGSYFEFEKYYLESKELGIALKNGDNISIGEIYYNSNQKNLQVKEIEFSPNKTPSQFFKSLKYRKGWIKLLVSELEVHDLDILKSFGNSNLVASDIFLKTPFLSVHTNSNIPMDKMQIKPMLGQILMKTPFPFLIENVKVTDATISLDMIGNVTTNHGKLEFHNMDITATNFTNMASHLTENKYLSINTTTKVNKTGKINGSFKIDLLSSTGQTQFNVNATQINLKNLTSVLKPILRISILDGQIISLKTTSTISSNGAIGTMDVHYENLKLQLESKDLSMNPGFFNSVASGLANGIIKSHNIPGNKNYHQGAIKFKKKNEDSFFKMLWLVNLHGLEDSILGSDAKDQRVKKKQEKKSQKNKWQIKR